MRFIRLVLTTALCLIACHAQADIVFSQMPDTVGGYYSNIPSQQIADDFTLSTTSSVNKVDWWGGYVSAPFAPDFTLRFFNDDGSGSPMLSPFVTPAFTNLTETSTGNTNTGFGGLIYFYTADLTSPVTFTAGTKYHLSVLDGTLNNWAWNDQDRINPESYRYADGTSWNTSPFGNRAFQLEATATPEPGSIALLVGMSVTGAGFLARRRRNVNKVA